MFVPVNKEQFNRKQGFEFMFIIFYLKIYNIQVPLYVGQQVSIDLKERVAELCTLQSVTLENMNKIVFEQSFCITQLKKHIFYSVSK